MTIEICMDEYNNMTLYMSIIQCGILKNMEKVPFVVLVVMMSW